MPSSGAVQTATCMAFMKLATFMTGAWDERAALAAIVAAMALIGMVVWQKARPPASTTIPEIPGEATSLLAAKPERWLPGKVLAG